MSVEAVAIALHHSRAKGTAKLVLVGIANHAGDGGAWPAMSTLARYANVHRSNAQRAIQTLVKLREIEVEVQAGGLPSMAEHERPNRYHMVLSCPPWCDRTMQHRDTRKPNRTARALLAGLEDAAPADPAANPRPGSESATRPAAPVGHEPSTNPTTDRNPVPSVGNRAHARKPAACPSTGDPHRLNKAWGKCADCLTAPEAWAWTEVPA